MTKTPEELADADSTVEAEKLWESCCSWKGADHQGWSVTQMRNFWRAAYLKGHAQATASLTARANHIVGKVYDLTQANFNRLISEIEFQQARAEKAEAELKKEKEQ